MQRIKADKQRDLCKETRRVSLQDVNYHHLQQGRASCAAASCARTYSRIKLARMCRQQDRHVWYCWLNKQLCAQFMHCPYTMLTAYSLSDQVKTLAHHTLLIAYSLSYQIKTLAYHALPIAREWPWGAADQNVRGQKTCTPANRHCESAWNLVQFRDSIPVCVHLGFDLT